jgi:tRNA pseudouridine38-40 synthase
VESELKNSLAKFFKQDLEINFAGRTDAGVHAIGQVINFKLDKKIEEIYSDMDMNNPHRILIALNSYLAEDLALTSIEEVADDFHARFSAKSREYLYKIFVRKHRPVLRTDSLSWVKEDLDYELMAEYAKSFIGTHNFSNYSKLEGFEESTECTIYKSELIKESGICFKYKIKANRFLRNMVRRIVGELIHVGKGLKPDQNSSSRAMPAEGLCAIV